jgi:ATP-dependent helicase/nuclease subunit A
VQHDAIRRADYGRIEVWPVVEPDPREEPAPWDAPFDVARAASPAARLAGRIAATIGHWLREGECLEATGRPITPADVMILVRNRRPFADPMIRALKAQDIPVAGADRLVLTEHIAVMDLMALARFCLLPEDDLNLAAR